MQLNTVIFDMDGLLIDSEPYWAEAADEVFKELGVSLTPEQYVTTTGLRTKEFLQHWFNHFNISTSLLPEADEKITHFVIEKVKKEAVPLQGVHYAFNLFQSKKFKIGLATSSPSSLIDVVVQICGIEKYLQAIASAEELAYGKPHPMVYLTCAEKLESNPQECICFEDSFNGMIAAKAAKMKCVVVPHHSQLKDERFGAADLKLSSLQNFSELHFNLMMGK